MSNMNEQRDWAGRSKQDNARAQALVGHNSLRFICQRCKAQYKDLGELVQHAWDAHRIEGVRPS